MGSQAAGDGARVHAAYGGYALRLQEFVQRHIAERVTWAQAVFAHHESGDLDFARFEVPPIDAVVADERVGGNNNLPRKRWVGEHLLVAGHRGGEHHFPECARARAKGVAAVDGAVFKN